MNNQTLSRKTIFLYFLILYSIYVLTAFLMPNMQDYDTYYFIYPWMENMCNNSFFSMYKEAENALYRMDYPPLYYSILYLTIGRFFPVMRSIKFFLPHIALRIFLATFYMFFLILIYKWFDFKKVLYMSVCIPFLLCIFYYSQSDVILILELYLMFYFYGQRNLRMVSIMYALIACTKVQGIYILPIYLLLLITLKKENKEKIKDFMIGVLTGFLIWLPWLLEEGIYLFFKIYLNIRDTNYKRLLSFRASNATILFADFFESVSFNESFYTALNIILILICVILFLKIYKHTRHILFSSYSLLYLIFMFTLYQHHRYILYSLSLLILCSFIEENRFFMYKKILLYQLIATIIQLAPFTNDASDIIFYPSIIFAFLLNLLTLVEIKNTYKKLKKDFETSVAQS